jgi:uncharacterized delta-60 repeat protein
MRCTRFFPVLIFAATAAASAQSLDAFNPLPGVPPTTLALQADGKILIAGNFLNVSTSTRERMARLNHDGSVDITFVDPQVNGEIKSIAVQADGKILIGGNFDGVGSATHHYLARLNGDGSPDASFADPALDSEVWAIAVQADGKVLAAGDFQHIGAIAQSYFARFSAAGAFDSSFADPQFCCSGARAVALQPDGRVLIGGYFSHAGGTSHFYFARYSSTGTFDANFPAVANTPLVGGIVVAPDGSIFVNDIGNETILKFTAAGAPDATFASAVADSTINSINLQPNGKIVIGGIFENVGGQPHHALARLSASGALDSTFADLNFSFSAANAHGYIYALAAQSNGDIVVAGNFPLADGQSRQYMARVVNNELAATTVTGVASGGNVILSWARAGSGAELVQPPLLRHSTDGVNYADAGTMTHVAGGWQITAPYTIAGAPFYLQAFGTNSSGAGNGSPGRVASPVFVSDRIFASGFE